jgi:hypothetical protein
MDGKANARRKRSNGNANQKKRNNKSISSNSKNDPNDTLSYSVGAIGKCNSVLVIMNCASSNQTPSEIKIDTLVISYTKVESEINELDRVQIDNYFRKTSVETISSVNINDCDPSAKKDEFTQGILMQRAAKLRDVLIEKGVAKKKINTN